MNDRRTYTSVAIDPQNTAANEFLHRLAGKYAPPPVEVEPEAEPAEETFSDWGGGARGTAPRPPTDMNRLLRDAAARQRGFRDY